MDESPHIGLSNDSFVQFKSDWTAPPTPIDLREKNDTQLREYIAVKEAHSCLLSSYLGTAPPSQTDKKENKIFLLYKNGAVAKSYMTNGILIYG
jgi:hypothetical protein